MSLQNGITCSFSMLRVLKISRHVQSWCIFYCSLGAETIFNRFLNYSSTCHRNLVFIEDGYALGYSGEFFLGAFTGVCAKYPKFKWIWELLQKVHPVWEFIQPNEHVRAFQSQCYFPRMHATILHISAPRTWLGSKNSDYLLRA